MEETALKPIHVDLDEVVESLGKAGRYQIALFLWISFPVLMCSIHANNYVFTTPDTTYRCHIAECEDPSASYETTWLSAAIPSGDKCRRYAPLSCDSSLEGCLQPPETCQASMFDKNKTIACDGYIFKDEDTFIEEVGIECEFWKRTLVGTMHSLGTLLALPIIGYLSDRYGRRLGMVVSGVVEGILGIVKAFSVNYAMFLAFEIIEPTLGSGIYSSAYILGLEHLLPSTRVFGGMLINVVFGLGQMTMAAVAWGIPYWRTYLIVIYAPSLLIVAYHWLIDESVVWLASVGQYQRIIDILNKISKINKRELPEKAMAALKFNADNAEKFDEESIVSTGKEEHHHVEGDKRSPMGQLIRSRILLLRILKVGMWWITCTFCFYGLSINAVSLAGTYYLNFILSALVEIPAHFAGFFSLNHLGRKPTMFISFFIGGICLVALPFIPEDLAWLKLVAYLVGKFCVSMAFSSVYLYTMELFPTQLRHSLLAACSMLGRIGSMLAPQTPLLAIYSEALPSLLFSATCIISAVLVLSVPETLNIRLPETVEEAEDIPSLKIPKKEVKQET